MKLASSWSWPSKIMFRLSLKLRRLLPKKRCQAFGSLSNSGQLKIGQIYVINLSRHPARWSEMRRELKHVLDSSGADLMDLAERYSAIDACQFLEEPVGDWDVDCNYTLSDQLFVEPQPLALPTRMELMSPIQMTRPEIAVARSHIDVWRNVIAGVNEYVLILEDDVWFRPGFAKKLNRAWSEIMHDAVMDRGFDIFYLSYEEVKHGAQKTFQSSSLFRPVRGLWNLSGYVVSRSGAQKLLQLLPCRGPVDLWINRQFESLNVLAMNQSVISQRPDFVSANSYSILPSLTKIGAITSESAALFQNRPNERPVFVFGPGETGLTSIAMALLMLGYRCCSDLDTIPGIELEKVLAGEGNRVFDAYVNIGSLELEAGTIKNRFPEAKFILTASANAILNENESKVIDDLKGADIIVVQMEAPNKWQLVCEHLRCAPPVCSFPELSDLGQRELRSGALVLDVSFKSMKRDNSPWVVERREYWKGISCTPKAGKPAILGKRIKVKDRFKFIDTKYWFPRNDTFTDNLALFRSRNLQLLPEFGAALTIKEEHLGVREFSAAALTSHDRYLYGRFEVTMKVSNVPGVVTGFFLHRDSPRQEIDIEIAGNRPDRLLVNVFYNPGIEGVKFDYGYRGAASSIDLGFDASESYHQYTIEWEPCEIRWFVDDRLVHTRVDWDPTPVPHLPMSLHANVWPCRSKELAGRLAKRRFPATTFINGISVDAHQHNKSI